MTRKGERGPSQGEKTLSSVCWHYNQPSVLVMFTLRSKNDVKMMLQRQRNAEHPVKCVLLCMTWLSVAQLQAQRDCWVSWCPQVTVCIPVHDEYAAWCVCGSISVSEAVNMQDVPSPGKELLSLRGEGKTNQGSDPPLLEIRPRPKRWQG